mgnify:CR=1 FL=1
MSKESIRTFIALEINEITKEKINRIQDKIKQTNSIKASWVSKNNLHLTLKFLGETQLKFIEPIKNNIKECLESLNAINCNITKAGVFPNEKFPRVAWVGIEEGKAKIIDLAKKIEYSIFKLGFKKEKREFKTHITICRIKQLLDYNQFCSIIDLTNKTFEPIEFTLNKITFFESQLSPQGSIYTELFRYILQ